MHCNGINSAMVLNHGQTFFWSWIYPHLKGACRALQSCYIDYRIRRVRLKSCRSYRRGEGCGEWGCGGCGNFYDRPLPGSAEREVAASEAAADAARQRQEVENPPSPPPHPHLRLLVFALLTSASSLLTAVVARCSPPQWAEARAVAWWAGC